MKYLLVLLVLVSIISTDKIKTMSTKPSSAGVLDLALTQEMAVSV